MIKKYLYQFEEGNILLVNVPNMKDMKKLRDRAVYELGIQEPTLINYYCNKMVDKAIIRENLADIKIIEW